MEKKMGEKEEEVQEEERDEEKEEEEEEEHVWQSPVLAPVPFKNLWERLDVSVSWRGDEPRNSEMKTIERPK